MKTPELHQWVITFGWTLVHSLWQAALIGVAYRILAALLPRAKASMQYLLSAGALVLMLLASFSTFLFLAPAPTVMATSPWAPANAPTTPTTPDTSLNVINSGVQWIENHLDLLLLIWFFGVVIFTLRLAQAWWQSTRLRRSAVAITGYWEENLEQLAAGMRVSAKVLLAQCQHITSPIVTGIFKPMILLPVGMLSGLTTDQVEAILLHELAHIRRHDYLMNIFQSLMEIVFFFNPFVWMVSSRMRTEREQCCDDVVIAYKNPIVYARALHQLEETRAFHSAVGIAAAGHKNQLLHRIKRIMEPTNTQPRGRRMVPSLIMLALLLTASWISVEATRNPLPDENFFANDTPADTVIKGKQDVKSYSYSRKSVTTYDAQGNPHEEIVEKSTGDSIGLSSMSNFIKEMRPYDPARFPNGLTTLPGEVEELMAPVEFEFADTLLPGNATKWKEFNKQFSEQFKNRFGDFYQKNGAELQKMMEEVEVKMQEMQRSLAEQDMVREQMNLQLNLALLSKLKFVNEPANLQALKEQAIAEQRLGIEEKMRSTHEQELDLNFQHLKSLDKLQDQALQKELLELQQLKLNELVLEQQHQLDLLPRDISDTGNPFNKALREQLVRDHYLSADENIESLSWDDNGIIINKKKVKAKDAEKYNKMLKDHWNSGPSRVGKPE